MSDWHTKDGQVLAWSEIDDRHLWNIVRYLTRSIRASTEILAEPAATMDARLARSAYYQVLNRYERRVARREFHNEIKQQRNRLRGQLAKAFAEIERRDICPTVDDLRVAWDRVCGGAGGPDLSQDPERMPWCFIELWVGFRGEPTCSPEWLAEQAVKRSARQPDLPTCGKTQHNEREHATNRTPIC